MKTQDQWHVMDRHVCRAGRQGFTALVHVNVRASRLSKIAGHHPFMAHATIAARLKLSAATSRKAPYFETCKMQWSAI